MNGRTALLIFVQADSSLFPVRSRFGSFPWGKSLSPARCRERSLLGWPQSPGPDPSRRWFCQIMDSWCLCGSDPEVKGSPWTEQRAPGFLSRDSPLLVSLSLSCARTISCSCRVSVSTPSRLSQASSASSGVRALTAGPGRFGSFYRRRLVRALGADEEPRGVCVSSWRPQALAAASVTEIRRRRIKRQRSCSKWFPGDSFSKH